MYKQALDNQKLLVSDQTKPNETKRKQSAGVSEYTDSISAEGENSGNAYPGYNTKQSDAEVLVMLGLGECGVPLHYHHF